ncbi:MULTISPECIES: UDP-N-acetyl-D-mannosamine dehydrogenase [unclassified Arthrobacter]|uniref:UDP-N-acetyl-D-mannosamine dehydrogenase n=1 Tax=unclassified Arthrobacter TaxID=235627 RepID=UPI001E5533BC|nr:MULTISPECIES: UDP-N-acetyl-D-mannosamine dehydrogenase [unclassified Arthrobacter]MCC9145764.1 UDP-N-acetyl-D-mannosamine dehydrogenase [Arthrobacter sp. zg-Y919]MDK1276993.1 UDP-N-acetyl-D-mannosamine dehydrogenase [Arthrobacter sp. zg.Y919]WIB04079.1 UDP-N-acetyl-D-mannosamine dehydrogenase [Arthrobacter sp. zg-Y919]
MNTLTYSAGETTTGVATVAVIGLGYIGLPTAAILAGKGLHVIGVDVNPHTVEAVNEGRVPFVEPDLGVHVAGAVSQGHLVAQSTTPQADAYIVAVPTPFRPDKTADLMYVEQAARKIAPQIQPGNLVILESTSPPGTTQRMADVILALRPDLAAEANGGEPAVLFAHCPERVLPGRIMIELVTNDRIIGGLTPEAATAAAALYSTFCQGGVHLTDAATAEMAKLVENAYRDVNIAFANELSVISGNLGIDVWNLIELANHHPRVNILQPGPGVGGHCIAVDPWFIVSADPENSRLIRTAREVNDTKPDHVVAAVESAIAGHEAPTIAALGLAFKANVDDTRESPAVEIVLRLASGNPGARIIVGSPFTDPVLPEPLTALGNVSLDGADAAVEAADVVVLLVDHDAFREITPAQLAGKAIVDTRGFWRA